MHFKPITLLYSVAWASLPAHPLHALSKGEPDTSIEHSYHPLLKGIEKATTEPQIFLPLQALSEINIEKLSYPFLLLVKLSQLTSLRKASLPLKMYYSYLLYVLSIKIFHEQCKKKLYISADEKKEVIENLNRLCKGPNTPHNSEVTNHIALAIAFIKILPENESSRNDMERLYPFLSLLLDKNKVSTKALETTLQAALSTEPKDVATYLVLLELVKKYYLKSADQQAFRMMATLLQRRSMPTIVQYRMHQVLGEIFRTLMEQGKPYEAYDYMEQLLSLMPIVLLSLSVENPLDEVEHSLLAEGLLIEWCLSLPYLYTLLDVKEHSYEALEEKIQERINDKGLKIWFIEFKDHLATQGLGRGRQYSVDNPLQAVLAKALYFQTVNLILGKAKQTFCQEDAKAMEASHTGSDKQEIPALDSVAEHIHTIDLQIGHILEAVKHIEKIQREQQRHLQAIKHHMRLPGSKEQRSFLADYPWLYPPYIWLITAGLLLLLIISAGLLIRHIRRKHPL